MQVETLKRYPLCLSIQKNNYNPNLFFFNIVRTCNEYTIINECVASVCDILECHNIEGHYDELLVFILATK
jgi:hypothetical protein